MLNKISLTTMTFPFLPITIPEFLKPETRADFSYKTTCKNELISQQLSIKQKTKYFSRVRHTVANTSLAG